MSFLRETGLIKEGVLPCANTIINWAMRAGFGKLNNVGKVDEEFMLIVDHWIGKGSQKIFAALRVLKSDYAKTVQEKRPLALRDIELVGLKVMRNANAQTNCQCLHELFNKIGDPVAIISDQASDLRSSVTLYNTLYDKEICHIKDYSHYAANALKKKYDKQEWFQEFLQNASTGSNKIRQTDYRAFVSPVFRAKARFMNLSKHAAWGLKIIAKVAGPRKLDDELQAKLQEVFSVTIKHRDQIKELATTIRIVNLLGKILKNRGLSQRTISWCRKIVAHLPEHDVVRQKIEQWFTEQSLILTQLKQKGWIECIPVSSDIIETFFSKLKLLQEIGLNEPSRIVLILPLLCGRLSIQRIKTNLEHARLSDVEHWLKENVPETSLIKRHRFLQAKRAKNGGVSERIIQLKHHDNLLKTGTG